MGKSSWVESSSTGSSCCDSKKITKGCTESVVPTDAPSVSPSKAPTPSPTDAPSKSPSFGPTAEEFILKVKGFHGDASKALSDKVYAQKRVFADKMKYTLNRLKNAEEAGKYASIGN